MQRDGSPAVLVLAVLCALSLSVAGQISSGENEGLTAALHYVPFPEVAMRRTPCMEPGRSGFATPDRTPEATDS